MRELIKMLLNVNYFCSGEMERTTAAWWKAQSAPQAILREFLGRSHAYTLTWSAPQAILAGMPELVAHLQRRSAPQAILAGMPGLRGKVP